MTRKKLPLLGALALFCLVGCGGSTGNPDGNGLPDGVDGDGGGEGDGAQEPALVVPEEISACSAFWPGRSALDEYRVRARFSLRPGRYPLPTDAPAFDLDLLQSLAFGPDQTAASIQGPGRCTHAYEGNSQNGYHAYDCTFDFLVGATPLHLRYQPGFSVVDGVPQQPDLVIDEVLLEWPVFSGWLNDGLDDLDLMHFASCGFPGFDTYRLTFDWQNGDRLVLDERIRWSPMSQYGKTSPAMVVRAEAVLGGQTRTAQDFFRVVYASEQHNWFEKYLVVLDPPEGAVHGVYTEETGLAGPPAEVLYLGATLDIQNPLSRSALDHYQVEVIPAP